jgi:hypothetical protein
VEKFLKKDIKFQWNDECQQSLDILKEKMVTTPILVFLDWSKEFHIHVYSSSIALAALLAQREEGDIDHLIAFASRKLLDSKQNYNTREREKVWLWCMHYKSSDIIYQDQHFKMFTCHSDS